ncbi:MAG: DUF1588 domain-containing protein [Planctomycetota bacterium]
MSAVRVSIIFVVTFAIASRAAEKPIAFDSGIKPFLQKHCVSCHGAEKPKAKFSLHDIGTSAFDKSIDKWKAVEERLTLNEMPPDTESRPDALAVRAVLDWIKSELNHAGVATGDSARKLMLPGHGNRVDHAALFAGTITEPSASPARIWRMSPQLYSSFIPRVTGAKAGSKNAKIAQAFSTGSLGFRDYSALYAIDEPTVDQLLRNAQQVVEIQSSKGPGGKAIKEFMALLDEAKPPGDAEIEAAIRKEFQMALLRDPTEDEQNRFIALMKKNIADAGQITGARDVLAAVLLLPEALYRRELGSGAPDVRGRKVLSPRELAFALAFALTDDAPDATLLKAAESGHLNNVDDARREVQRLLDDKKTAKPRIMRFFEEYFEFPSAADVFKDLQRGAYRPEILVSDTRNLIQYFMDRDKEVLKELLTTNKSFVNYRVDAKLGAAPAKAIKVYEQKIDKNTGKPKPPPPREMEIHDYYSLPQDWKWSAEQPIEMPAEQRAGILTQPSWLAGFATNDETHAIRRGKWIRERLLGNFIPDIPITVDAQLPNDKDKTLRQRMEVTKQAYCWQCHQKMNPLGLAFENYDFIGRYRKTVSLVNPLMPPKQNPKKKDDPPVYEYHDVPLDSSGVIEFSGEKTLDGPGANAVELIRKLADSPRVRQVFVRHAFRYWMGRNEILSDAPTLLAADKAYVASGGSMKALIAALLTSDSFLYRTEPGTKTSAAQSR